MRADNSFIINSIKNKISEVSSLNQTSREEVIALQNVLKQLNDELDQKSREVNRLNLELENVVKSQSNHAEPKTQVDLKAKIDGMVKEIDRCIALLNN
jgi:chromosome segregation ATPase